MNLLLHPKMNFGVKSEPSTKPPAAVVKVHASCKQAYDELCNKHQHAYLIFRISDNDATITVEKKGAKDAPYSEFVDEMRKLIADGGKHSRYAAVDVPQELKPAQVADGITRISKVVFMQFFPDGKRNIIWTRTMVDKREGRETQKKYRNLQTLGAAISKRAKSVGAALSRRHRIKSASPIRKEETEEEEQDSEAKSDVEDKQSVELDTKSDCGNLSENENRHLLTIRRQNSKKKNSAGSLSVI